jgi:hypothetical protein
LHALIISPIHATLSAHPIVLINNYLLHRLPLPNFIDIRQVFEHIKYTHTSFDAQNWAAGLLRSRVYAARTNSSKPFLRCNLLASLLSVVNI